MKFISIRRVFAALGLSVLLAVSSGAGLLEQATAATPGHIQYAALGDSIAAGAGLSQSPTATPEDRLCDRSPQAYPNLVGRAVGLPSANIACSGATTDDFFTAQYSNVGPQLDAAFATGTPRLITMTIGANDVHWSDFINECFSGANCDTPTNAALFDSYIAALKLNMSKVLAGIQLRSTYTHIPLVIITGYYHPVSDQCLGVTPLTASEIAFVNSKTDELNQTLRNATYGFDFARFAPISFAGHDICSVVPWMQTFSQPAPFHPTAFGQEVISSAIVHALRFDEETAF